MDNGNMEDEGKEEINVDMNSVDNTSEETGGVVPEEACDIVPKADGVASENETKIEEKSGKTIDSTESEIGITEYLGTHPGFFGILKQRYSDFVVNEVSSSGEVIHLTDQSTPHPPQAQAELPDEIPPELSPDVIQQLDELAGAPRPASITVLQSPKKAESNCDDAVTESPKEVQNISPSKKGVNEVLINVNGVSKEGRTNIHRYVKAKYNNVVSCFKEGDDGNKYIVIQKNKKGGGATIPKRSSWLKSHMYTTFVMYKENIDTMEAINYMAARSGVKSNIFTYAGTKDRRGKTCQLVSVPRVTPERLSQAACHRAIHLGNFRFLPTPQKLGQLRGNKFQIALREVKGDDDIIKSSVESLKTNGFINYFGSQRFGTTAIKGHTIGRELLRSNWQKAIDLILAPRESSCPLLTECRTIWNETGNAEAAFNALKRKKGSSIEGQLLSGLKNHRKNDLVGALGAMPRNTRLLYLHAYQSYIWNKVVSRRVAKYGLNVLPGDIVRSKDTESIIEDSIEEDEEGESNEGDTDDSKKAKSAVDRSNFHILSEEEVKTTPITDVLLPLPGYQIEFPHNEIKDWYVELLEADELSIPDLQHRTKFYALVGNYRRLIVQPSEVSSCITFYDDPTKALIQSDLDKLTSQSVEENLLKEGKNKAVLIDLTLPSSSYATMALRELLKMDTSSAFQSQLNTATPSSESKAVSSRLDEGKPIRYGNSRYDGENGFKHHSKQKFHHRQGKDKFDKQGRGQKRRWKDNNFRGGKRGKYSW